MWSFGIDREAGLPTRIVLIGPSGSGKSELAIRLANRLGYEAVDTDALIVQRIGMTIGTFFARFGEAAFRAIEAQAVAESAQRERVVIATGGGAVLSQANWVAWRPGSVVLALSADPETLIQRVRTQALRDGDEADRPLLAGDAPARMRAMLSDRAYLYAQADGLIDTDVHDLDSEEELALESIVQAVAGGRVPLLSIGTPVERSDIYVGRGLRSVVPSLIRQRWPRARRVWVITDENVAGHWLAETLDALTTAGFQTEDMVVAPGEASKSMTRVAEVCDALTLRGAGRRDVVLALGGGVIGDLSGFVAAICLRGLSLVQVPTTLLAMVDSSVGGKTGVNNAAGKNMIGAFYQPGIVVIDPEFLSTLPRDEYRSGMGEVIKHSVIQRATPFGGDGLSRMLRSATALDPIDGVDIESVLALNVAIKHSVVQADERETGLRMILNFGHTAGHAIEADGYHYRHGEAVALGMLIASDIARRMGRIDQAWDESLAGLIVRAGLPMRVIGNVEAIVRAMMRDKKAVDGAQNWILPGRESGVDIVQHVPRDDVVAALHAIGAS